MEPWKWMGTLRIRRQKRRRSGLPKEPTSGIVLLDEHDQVIRHLGLPNLETSFAEFGGTFRDWVRVPHQRITWLPCTWSDSDVITVTYPIDFRRIIGMIQEVDQEHLAVTILHAANPGTLFQVVTIKRMDSFSCRYRTIKRERMDTQGEMTGSISWD